MSRKGLKEAEKLGFPIFIKASAGGGGKGIRIAYDEKNLSDNLLQPAQKLKRALAILKSISRK